MAKSTTSHDPGAALMSIGQLAKRCGVASSALRFYEGRGLIRSERNASGYRQYTRATIRRVAFIMFAQRVGLSLEEIAAELATLPENRIPKLSDWTVLSESWARHIDGRIAELLQLRDGLSGCIGCGCLSLDRCHLVNPNDRAAELGAGPRYWPGKRQDQS